MNYFDTTFLKTDGWIDQSVSGTTSKKVKIGAQAAKGIKIGGHVSVKDRQSEQKKNIFT